jgi:hypothetical protein
MAKQVTMVALQGAYTGTKLFSAWINCKGYKKAKVQETTGNTFSPTIYVYTTSFLQSYYSLGANVPPLITPAANPPTLVIPTSPGAVGSWDICSDWICVSFQNIGSTPSFRILLTLED